MSTAQRLKQKNRVGYLISRYETISKPDGSKLQDKSIQTITRLECPVETLRKWKSCEAISARTCSNPPNGRSVRTIEFDKQFEYFKRHIVEGTTHSDEATLEYADIIFRSEVEKERNKAREMLSLYTHSIGNFKHLENDKRIYSGEEDDFNNICVDYDDSAINENDLYNNDNEEIYDKLRKINMDGEYIVLRNPVQQDAYGCLVIYDANNNPRMETISRISLKKDEKLYLFEELITSEENYIASLEYVIDQYMKYFSDRITNVRQYIPCIFINIEEICLESKGLLEELQQCKASKKPYDEIGKIFCRHKKLLNKYPIYIKGKTKSLELIDGELKPEITLREVKLQDKLGLSSYLLKPIQRLGKYELMLKKLVKLLKQEDAETAQLEEAIELIVQVTNRGNSLLKIDEIINNPFTYIDTGDLIVNDNFKMISPKRTNVHVYLCKKKLIFATKHPKRTDRFNYRHHIDVECLARTSINSEPTFSVSNYNKRKKQPPYVLEARSMEIKQKWITEIDALLWEQLQKCKDEVRQLHLEDDLDYIESDYIASNRTFSRSISDASTISLSSNNPIDDRISVFTSSSKSSLYEPSISLLRRGSKTSMSGRFKKSIFYDMD